MKIFVKPVCSKSVKASVISKLSFHLHRQDELMLGHVHSDLWVAHKGTEQ